MELNSLVKMNGAGALIEKRTPETSSGANRHPRPARVYGVTFFYPDYYGRLWNSTRSCNVGGDWSRPYLLVGFTTGREFTCAASGAAQASPCPEGQIFN